MCFGPLSFPHSPMRFSSRHNCSRMLNWNFFSCNRNFCLLLCDCGLASFSTSTDHVPAFTLKNLSWLTLPLTKKREADAQRISPLLFFFTKPAQTIYTWSLHSSQALLYLCFCKSVLLEFSTSALHPTNTLSWNNTILSRNRDGLLKPQGFSS